MKDLLEIGIIIAGVSLTLLCIGSLWIPKVLNWKEKTASLTPLMRELWWTYSVYVWGSHIFFAVLTLFFSDWLLSQTTPAAAMCTFILLWWSIRLYLQFFGFDFAEIKNTPFNRIAKHLLTALFIGLVVLFAILACFNLGWLTNP